MTAKRRSLRRMSCRAPTAMDRGSHCPRSPRRSLPPAAACSMRARAMAPWSSSPAHRRGSTSSTTPILPGRMYRRQDLPIPGCRPRTIGSSPSSATSSSRCRPTLFRRPSTSPARRRSPISAVCRRKRAMSRWSGVSWCCPACCRRPIASNGRGSMRSSPGLPASIRATSRICRMAASSAALPAASSA